MQMDYFLVESIVTVSGTLDYVSDKYDRDGNEQRRSGPSTAMVALGIRGDAGDGKRSLVFGRDSADEDFTALLTSDGRLSGISDKSVGAGGRLVASAATVVGFVAGIAAGGAFGAEPRDADGKKAAPADATPEQKARAAWEKKNPDLAKLKERYTGLVKDGAQKLADARCEALEAETLDQVAALARSRRLEQLVAEGQRELEKLDALYRAWRADTITTRAEAFVRELSVDKLPKSADSRPPVPAELGDLAKQIWEDLGVIVQMEPFDAGSLQRSGVDVPLMGDERTEGALIRWRVARPVRLSIWRRDVEGKPTLERSFPTFIVDKYSDTRAIRLEKKLFGEESGEIQFGALGMPTKITRSDKGPLAAFAEALAGVPEGVAGGLESASKVQSTFTNLRDAGEERELAAVKRRMELAQQRLESKGVAATSADFVELKRLEQQVALADAQGKLAPPGELDALKQDLELIQTRSGLRAAERSEALDAELAELRAEIARMEARLKAAELRGKDGP